MITMQRRLPLRHAGMMACQRLIDGFRSSSLKPNCSCYPAFKGRAIESTCLYDMPTVRAHVLTESELNKHIIYHSTSKLSTVCCTDLQQAFRKAMSRIDMEAEAPAMDAEILAQTDREQELLDRIAELEAKLQMQEARH